MLDSRIDKGQGLVFFHARLKNYYGDKWHLTFRGKLLEWK
jgi:hypothetical protein